jgi:hypothetical protein
MKPKRRSLRGEDAGGTLTDPRERERLGVIKSLLRRHRVHTRDIVNGKDFLFSGPSEELHRALRDLLEVEHRAGKSLLFDFAQVDQYFLLRITGPKEHQEVISEYFD